MYMRSRTHVKEWLCYELGCFAYNSFSLAGYVKILVVTMVMMCVIIIVCYQYVVISDKSTSCAACISYYNSYLSICTVAAATREGTGTPSKRSCRTCASDFPTFKCKHVTQACTNSRSLTNQTPHAADVRAVPFDTGVIFRFSTDRS